jgi:hypothetical protein
MKVLTLALLFSLLITTCTMTFSMTVAKPAQPERRPSGHMAQHSRPCPKPTATYRKSPPSVAMAGR